MGNSFQEALSAAEPTHLQADQIARSLVCNHSGGMWKYHLNQLRLSWHIRKHFSQREISTIYANRAYFGVGIVGIEKASQVFFQKEPQALSTEQAALIAGLLRAPDYLDKHPEQAWQRRNYVLNEMVVQGTLSDKDAARLAATPVVTHISGPMGPADQQANVTFEGLKSEYASCEVVQFTVRNNERTKLYVQVYAEQFESGDWKYVDFTYDLTDPRSLYIKRVGLGRNLMQPNGTTRVNYDRCLKPNFVKETDTAYAREIRNKDRQEASLVLQRLRADVYGLDPEQQGKVRQVWSSDFRRLPEK